MVPRDARLLMTPGPTERSLLEKLASVYQTDDDVLILGGEGMLGLDASVGSLVEPGETVLCLSNGVFGAGFADLVETHGGDR